MKPVGTKFDGAGIVTVGSPELDVGDLPGEGQPLSFSIEIGVRPKATLGDYKGLEVGRREPKVEDAAIDAEVDLHMDKGEFFLSARLNISIPGIERSTAQTLVDVAKGVCPYSKATKGNIDVTYTVV